MRCYVDIDGTICTQEDHYRDAEPIPTAIEKINRLFDAGYIITYWTARGGTSRCDYEYLTKRQLKEWGCKYHFLSIGEKPGFDLLIDDRARRIDEI